MERCTKCHLAIIPDEVLDIWEKKFGKRGKPFYWMKCKLCGVTAGKHYGTDCPDERVKKLAGICECSLAASEELVRFCESKERLNEDGVCPTKAYELAKAAIAKAQP